MYTSFSGDGVMTQMWMPKDKKQDHLLDECQSRTWIQDIDGSPDRDLGQRDHRSTASPARPHSSDSASILQSPDWIKAVNEAIRKAAARLQFRASRSIYLFLPAAALVSAAERKARHLHIRYHARSQINSGKLITVQAAVQKRRLGDVESREGERRHRAHGALR